MSILAFLRKHMREGGHTSRCSRLDLSSKRWRVSGSPPLENRHGVVDVVFFLGRDAGKGPA